jgi:hypothetical protein
MDLFTGDLGPTDSYTRREYRALTGTAFSDGRDATVWFEHWTAKSRFGTKSKSSRYAVGEVPDVGFRGRTWVFDKVGGDDEHGEPREGVREPPYVVRVGDNGEARCQCMADACDAPCCRHVDVILALLDQGAFSDQIQGA